MIGPAGFMAGPKAKLEHDGPSVHDQVQDILNKMGRAHKRGTGCRLTAHEMHILSVTMIGQWWAQPDERTATSRVSEQ